MPKRLLWVGVAALLAALPVAAFAADHLDYPDADSDPTSDITDLFAWTSDDASSLRLALGVSPFATESSRFSTATQYVFHVANGDGFGNATEDREVVCQFYSESELECWVLGPSGDVLDYVAGDASSPSGLTSESGDVRLFAGLRNDPFYFELTGFNQTRALVLDAAGGLTFDAAGCPALDEATSGALVGQLQSGAEGAAASDTFAGANVLALVLEIDKGLLTRDGNEVLAIWASTHRAP